MKQLVNQLTQIINLIGGIEGATETIDNAVINLTNRYAKEALSLRYYYPIFAQKMSVDSWGQYSSRYGEIYINKSYSHICKMMNSKRYDMIAELIDTILHESRHAWQDEQGVDKSNYVSSDEDFDKYMQQDTEVDAREWAAENMGNAIDYIVEHLIDEIIKKDTECIH